MSAPGIAGRYCVATRTVFEVDGLFDGERVLENAAIVVEGPQITWAGERGKIPKSPSNERSETIRGPGQFALPGLINCHCHLTLDGEANFDVEVRQSDALATLKAFRKQVHAGARVIKLFSTGGILGGGTPPEVSQYTADETAAAVEEAHRAGLRITTHAHGAGGMRVAAEAGIDSIEHATLLDDKTIKLIKERDVALVPTLLVVHSLLENASALDSVIVERTRAVSEKHREGLLTAHKAGVRIATGTDAGASFTRHDRFAVELQLLTECGLSTTEALAAATSGAAAVVGLEKAGHIGAGCWADLVFVDGDPLKDLAVLMTPKGVYVRGAAAV